MLPSVLAAYLHFICVFGIASALIVEWLTLAPTLTLAEARRIQKADRWYGILATLLLVDGFLRVLYFEKGKTFYFGNDFFRLKMLLFLVVGLLSIYPTVRFIRWTRQLRHATSLTLDAAEFTLLRRLIGAELIGVAGIAFCASLMAKGVTL